MSRSWGGTPLASLGNRERLAGRTEGTKEGKRRAQNLRRLDFTGPRHGTATVSASLLIHVIRFISRRACYGCCVRTRWQGPKAKGNEEEPVALVHTRESDTTFVYHRVTCRETSDLSEPPPLREMWSRQRGSAGRPSGPARIASRRSKELPAPPFSSGCKDPGQTICRECELTALV